MEVKQLIWGAPIAITILLALPALSGNRPLAHFLRALGVSFAGVLVPLFFYFASTLAFLLMTKDSCTCGWVDGFMLSKLALAPLVLFSTASLYWIEVLWPNAPDRPDWVRLGLYCGAITWGVGIIYALTCGPISGSRSILRPLLGLSYLPVWYTWRACQQPSSRPLHLLATIAMVPFWIGSAIWASIAFERLPSNSGHNCFVVTAATRGHRRLVGPLFEIERHGHTRQVNQQLLTFWQFESAWQRCSPSTHAHFRAIYNFLGPRVAARIRTRWAADAVYLLLKPIELIVTMIGPTISNR